MFKNYIKITFRNLLKHKIYTIINILGLVIGLTSVLLIIAFVQEEFSYDMYHENIDQLVRITGRYDQGGDSKNNNALTNFQLAPKLKAAFPFLRKIIRMGWREGIVKYKDKKFKEMDIYLVDEDIFDVFSFNLIKGNPKTALKTPFSMVITENIGKKYFANEDPINKTLKFQDKIFNITGVMEEIPSNSHFKADFFISITTAEDIYSKLYLEDLSSLSVYTYVLLPDNYTPEQLEKLMPQFIKDHWPEWAVSYMELLVQAVKEIHLHSHLNSEIQVNGDIKYVYIFSIVALFIVLLASINYMNLAVARSLNRALEVGIRKVLGALRRQITFQFLIESVLISIIAFLIAIFSAKIAILYFNNISGKDLQINFFTNYSLFIYFILLSLLVGIFSGSYPAFLLSAFRPIKVLKGNKVTTNKNKPFSLKKGLVILQFVISTSLICSSIIIYNQLDFMRNKKLGIAIEQIVVLPLPTAELSEKYEVIKKELSNHSNIIGITGANHSLARRVGHFRKYKIEGLAPENEEIVLNTLIVDHDFFGMLGVKFLEGRDFSKDFLSDVEVAYIINKSAQYKLKLDDPINRSCEGVLFTAKGERSIKKGKIIGIVKDFNFTSLHQEIQPVIFNLNSKRTWPIRAMLIKINAKDITSTLDFIEKKWQEFSLEQPFTYSFLDKEFSKLYEGEVRLSNIITTFSLLAILIACLGLFGLTAFMTEQRTKEIGIRKVLGASVIEIVMSLSKDFTKWALYANIVAWPLAYWIMNKWLQNFAYRVNIQWQTFFLAALITQVIAITMISYQVIKAAKANPVKALRYE